jgi:hypothetical protein
MAIEIINNGVNLIIKKNGKSRRIPKGQIQEVSIVKDTILKLDVGKGLNNIFIDHAVVTNPLTDTPGDLELAVDAMLQSGEIGAELSQMKAGIDTLNEKINVLNDRVFLEPIQVDESTPSTIYRGYAVPGTLTNAPSWAIERAITTDDVTTKKWADGNKNFDNIWDNRETLAYA